MTATRKHLMSLIARNMPTVPSVLTDAILKSKWLAAHDAEVRAGVVAEEPEWEYGGIPITSDGEEWVVRDLQSCEELVNEHQNPQHWLHEPHNSDLAFVTSYRVVRRRKAGPWESVE